MNGQIINEWTNSVFSTAAANWCGMISETFHGSVSFFLCQWYSILAVMCPHSGPTKTTDNFLGKLMVCGAVTVSKCGCMTFLLKANFGHWVLPLPASVCVCVCMCQSVCQSLVFCAITQDLFKLNYQIWTKDAEDLGWGPYFFFFFFFGGGGCNWPWTSRSNLT